ncbi:ATP-dependent DNA ligase [Vulcanococcus sp. Clear-D1]|uniref:ATP-dependent DNA ligase n=1 Tax=Vulcanococcus sp. Clear-D1 TaxID=2766970 RepID=UPI0019B42D16|nr:ATP-dependent DNA ligase [Vulcanococcus sp. Clear-D1]MBD1193480.1 ATP-dependent DNA ligase [Vulcanococcus sp. Clear-D1]
MQAFAALFRQLDGTGSTSAKLEALQAYFLSAAPADAAWALALLLGKRRRRLITGRRLREICLAGTELPEWLFEACHAQVGDSAETVALLWQQRADGTGEPSRWDSNPGRVTFEDPLALWMDERLPQLAALDGEKQTKAVQACWRSLPPDQLLLVNKLLSGGFRVGVSTGLVTRALAQSAELDEALVAHRLMGGFTPSAAAFAELTAADAQGESLSARPYPFFLASPLEAGQLEQTPPEGWQLEWKWDGIRGQLIHRSGGCSLWSRGEELINEAFPELIALAEQLPQGTALDGEVIVWHGDAETPEAFTSLQRRLGRKAPSRSLQRDCPAAFVAYDLLEDQGTDLRQQPLQRRREQLEQLYENWQDVQGAEGKGRMRLSPTQTLRSWGDLDHLRDQARGQRAEGLMLKALDSPYLVGRKRGHWWKHKLEPLRLDAVLLYAQAGSGKRANLYTDYSFGLWNSDGELVTFAKAYSGLDNAEIRELDRWIRAHTTERFGPVRAVEPLQVFELAFEGIQPSKRHKCGFAVRFPRISRWRTDKPASEADSLANAMALMEQQP